MRRLINYLLTGSVILGAALFYGCSKDDPNPTYLGGEVALNFEHNLNGLPVEFDNLKYLNAAGNVYEVSEIQWFVSDITLNREDGVSFLLDNDFAHYVDTDISASHEWRLTDSVAVGDYSSITMTFGIKGEKNIPLRFPDQPESDMLWPYHMGGDQGGYHYMKLNGFWLDKDGLRQPFNFHLGVGKVFDENGVQQYIQNWFEVDLESSFSISDKERKVITIEMNIENWFQDPNQYDHNVFGAKIMDNQEAMRKGCENGQNGVFAIGSVRSESVGF